MTKSRFSKSITTLSEVSRESMATMGTRQRGVVIQDILPIGVVLLVAAVLRLWQLGSQSMWYDEAVVVMFAGKSLPWIFQQVPNDTMPPLGYVLLHYWLGLGQGEWGMRLLSALFSHGAVLVAYLLGRRLFGTRVALLSALLAAVSPFQIYFAQEARMYAQLSFFSLLAAYCFVKAWQEGGRWAWVGFAMASAGAAYTHNLGLLTIFTINSFALVMLWRSRGRLMPWIASNGLMALLYAPWLVVLREQLGAVGRSFWVQMPSPMSIPATFYSFLFAYTLDGVALIFGLSLVIFLVLLGLYLSVRSNPSKRRIVDGPGDGTTDKYRLGFCLAMLFMPPLATYFISLYRPIYLDRALIGSSFFLYFILALTFQSIKPSWLRWALGGALGLALAVGLYNYYFGSSFARPPMRLAALSLVQDARPEDGVLHTSDGSFLPFIFYDKGREHRLIEGDPDMGPGRVRTLALSILGLQTEKAESLVEGKTRIWLVVALDHSAEWQLATKNWFDGRFRLEKERDFGGIKEYLYIAD